LTEIRDTLKDIKLGQQELLLGQQELLLGQQKLLKAPAVIAGVYFSRIGDIWDFGLEKSTGGFHGDFQRSKECPAYIVALLNHTRSRDQAKVGSEQVSLF
jgi:hypothetical protein